MTFRAEFEHRDDLRRAAIEEFSARGYDAASINRILAAAGVSKGQLYHHFDGKSGLYLALVEWMIDQRTRWFETHPLPAAGDGFFETLGARMTAAADFAGRHPEVRRLTRSLLAERGRPIFDQVTERFGTSTDGDLAELVARHHARGAFRSDLSVTVVHRAVALIVDNAPDLLDLNDADDLRERIPVLLDLLAHGIAGDAR